MDLERRAAVDVALVLAEDAARGREYGHALAYLDAADDLTGGSLGPRLAIRRTVLNDALLSSGGPRMAAVVEEVPLA